MSTSTRLCRACAVSIWAMTLATPAVAQGPSSNRTTTTATSATGSVANMVRNLGAAPLSPANHTETMELEVGEQRVISAENVQSYSEGVKGIVDVRLTKDASQFIVVGLREGASVLLFLMNDGSEHHYKITVNDPNLQKKAQKNAATGVEARDNIRLDFYFVQLSKKSGYQIGMGWPGSVASTMNATFDARAGSLESATVVVSNQALPRLDMGQSSGWAKVMHQAAVVTANGEKAAFAGGGEINVAIKSAMTTGIQKIPFGSQIEVEPRYDSKTGRIDLRLHADVSELDDDQGTGVPARTTATVDTVVNLEIGQSLVLGGLSAKSERSSKSGLPLLSQIPILGVLFGSHSHSDSDTENVVLIVPSVVDAVSMQDRERLTNAVRRYSDYSGDLAEGARLVPETKANKQPANSAKKAP
jgi:pilus assembly protein CpaC